MLRVINDLHLRYLEVIGAQRAVSLSQDLLRVAEEGLRTTEEMLAVKQAARADVLQARIQRDVVEVGLQDAHYRYDAAWQQLATIIGRPGMSPVELQGRLDVAIPQLDFEDKLAQLLASSPQLRAAQTDVYHAQAELDHERANRVPNVTLQTVIEYDRSVQSTNLTTLVAAPVPFFNRNQGNISRAEAAVRADRGTGAGATRAARPACRFVSPLSIRAIRSSGCSGQFRNAKENLDLTTEGYRQGEFDFLRVLSARQTYFQANLVYIESLVEARKVLVEIEGLQLTGGLNPAALGTAIQTGPGGTRQRALLNQMQDSSTKQLLPGAIQAGP